MADARTIQDAIFLDPQQALAIARQANRVELTIAVTGLQLCYYLAQEPLPESCPNLIHVHPSQLMDFLCITRLRMPRVVCIPESMDQALGQQIAAEIGDVIDAATMRRKLMTQAIAETCWRMKQPDRSGRPMRVMAWSSRTTTVMQYASKGLLDAFAALGHDTRFVIEANEMETVEAIHFYTELLEYKPDLVLNVNYTNNAALPPWMGNVVWWQDLMPDLLAPEKMHWRQRDLVYVLHRDYFQHRLVARGLEPDRIRYRPFCIDTEIFHGRGDEPREEKAVFVGVSNRHRLDGSAAEGRLLRKLTDLMEGGVPVVREQIEEMARIEGVEATHAWTDVYNYLSRDLPVRWLCRQKDIPVEVYGRYWEADPEVRPFFRGEIEHGPKLASLLRGARYSLCLHLFMIHHQRLGESAACGCIPLVYDNRHACDPPYWDSVCRYFRTEQQLHRLLAQDRGQAIDTRGISEFFDFRVFARQIIEDLGAIPAGA